MAYIDTRTPATGPLRWAAAPSAGSCTATTSPSVFIGIRCQMLVSGYPAHMNASVLIIISSFKLIRLFLFCFKSTIQGVKVTVRSGRQQRRLINHRSVRPEIAARALGHFAYTPQDRWTNNKWKEAFEGSGGRASRIRSRRLDLKASGSSVACVHVCVLVCWWCFRLESVAPASQEHLCREQRSTINPVFVTSSYKH